MNGIRTAFLILGIGLHALLIWSWSSHLQLVSAWPPEVGPVQDWSHLAKIDYKEPIRGRPLLLVLLFGSTARPRISSEIQQVPLSLQRTWIDNLFGEPERLNPGFDFFQFYRAGKMLRHEISIYRTELFEYEQSILDYFVQQGLPPHHPFRYFPLLAYGVGFPATFIKPWNAYCLWVLMLELVFLLTCLATWRWFESSRAKVAIGLWLWYSPYYLDLYLGQTSFLIGSLLFLALCGLLGLSKRFTQALIYLSIGLGMIIKPVCFTLAPSLLLTRRWKYLLPPIGALAATSAYYFYRNPEDLSLFASWFMGAQPRAGINFPGLLVYLIPATGILLVGFGFIVLSGYFTLRYRGPSVLICSLWVCTYFLSYSHVWEHHYAFIVAVLILLWLRTGNPVVLIFYALVAIPSPYVLFPPELGYANKIIVRIPKIIGVIGCYIWLIHLIRIQRLDEKMDLNWQNQQPSTLASAR